MKTAFGFSAAVVMVIGGAAQADVLYDNAAGSGTAVNQEFGDFPTYSTYLVADMTLGSAYNLTQVTVPFTVNAAWGAVVTARLHIFAGGSALPGAGDDPSASMIVNVSYDVNTGIITTVGLDVDVAAGDYWIGLTPIGDFGAVGQAFNMSGVDSNGFSDAARNPGGGFGFPAGGDWFAVPDQPTWKFTDIAIKVEGNVIPAPGAFALLGIAGLAARRRRRR